MSETVLFSGFKNYYTIEDAYSIHRLMNGNYRVVPDNPNYFTDYQTRASIIDEEGNEYRFQHSHSDSNLHGRPLPRMVDDCPRPNAEISKVTGECLDVCQTDWDCPVSYGCRQSEDGMNRCYPQACSKNEDCVTRKCTDQNVCLPLPCSNALETSEHFGENERFPQERCISTSHYWLKGRPGNVPLVGDKRYLGMY